MTLLNPPASSSAGYYPEVLFPDWFDAPGLLKEALLELGRRRYLEVDEAGERPHAIEEAFHAVLALLGDQADPERYHRRLVWLGLIMAMASCWPLRGHEEWRRRAHELHEQVTRWLAHGQSLEGPVDDELFPRVASRYQELDEAKSVHRHLSLMPQEPERSPDHLLDILDATLDGFAIRPSYDGARDLFHWFLSQAVPAACLERLPDHIWNGFWPWPSRGGESPSATSP